MDKLSDRPSVSSKPIYPSFRIDLEHMPEAKDWKVGNDYEITMKVKMTGISQSRYQNDAEFEIREIETTEGDNDDDETKDDNE